MESANSQEETATLDIGTKMSSLNSQTKSHGVDHINSTETRDLDTLSKEKKPSSENRTVDLPETTDTNSCEKEETAQEEIALRKDGNKEETSVHEADEESKCIEKEESVYEGQDESNSVKADSDNSEEDNLSDTCNSQDVSYISQDSNDCSTMEDATSSLHGDDTNDFTKEEGSRRKYKRKVYDPNATRTKLPRRAKDLKFDADSDFIEMPQFPRGRGRGRGRKKLFDLIPAPEVDGNQPPPSVETPTRGRGRGRGRGRTPKVKTPRSARPPRPPKFQAGWDESARMGLDPSGTPSQFSDAGSPWSSLKHFDTPTNPKIHPKKKVGLREVFDPSSQTPLAACQLTEYGWPLEDTNAELWMVQEQVSSYLSVKGSFKRKYPDIRRRTVDIVERNYLRDRRVVSDTQADLGVTAVLSRQILDIFFNDFPDKYEEYLAAQSEKKEQAYKAAKPKTSLVSASATPAEKKPFDPRLRAIKATAKWNSMFNKERVEERFHCLDLQTFTEHIPRRFRVPLEVKPDPYPVAVIPGQYSSVLKTYSPYQLKCLPLGTVLRGPLVGLPDRSHSIHRRKRRPTVPSSARTESAESQSDSDDSSSSSDDSSSDSSDDSKDSSSSSDDDSDEGPSAYKNAQQGICKLCHGDKYRNKDSKREQLVRCAKCRADGHLTCWELDVEMASQIRAYPWQCNDCKTCDQCHDPADEEKMLFCDYCDRGYHIYCVGLRKIPDGRWHCPACARCGSCGTQDPSGTEGNKQWIHEYKVNSSGAQVYAVTLCGVCVKLWRKGSYCTFCNGCFGVRKEQGSLIVCKGCSRRAHADCLAQIKKEYLCTTCTDKAKYKK